MTIFPVSTEKSSLLILFEEELQAGISTEPCVSGYRLRADNKKKR